MHGKSEVTATVRTANGLHILGCLNVEHLAQLAKGRGAIVFPLEIC